MDPRTAQFLIGAASPSQYPQDGKPEIALVGRSNVGKSTLVNTLTGRRTLARTSNQPGRTRTANYYLIDGTWYLVDLPGYGYARVSREIRDQWNRLLDAYLNQRAQLCCVVMVVDMRHPPGSLDQEMFARLRQIGRRLVVAASKADKISKGQWRRHLNAIRRGLGMAAGDTLIPFSAVTRTGREELLAEIGACLST